MKNRLRRRLGLAFVVTVSVVGWGCTSAATQYLREYEAGCNAGDAEDCYAASQQAKPGYGNEPALVEKYLARALELFERECAEQGPQRCYEIGQRVEGKEGAPFLEKACAAELLGACTSLADRTSYSARTPEEKNRIGELYARDCQKGRMPSCAFEAAWYGQGRGMADPPTLDPEKAERLRVKACTSPELATYWLCKPDFKPYAVLPEATPPAGSAAAGTTTPTPPAPAPSAAAPAPGNGTTDDEGPSLGEALAGMPPLPATASLPPPPTLAPRGALPPPTPLPPATKWSGETKVLAAKVWTDRSSSKMALLPDGEVISLDRVLNFRQVDAAFNHRSYAKALGSHGEALGRRIWQPYTLVLSPDGGRLAWVGEPTDENRRQELWLWVYDLKAKRTLVNEAQVPMREGSGLYVTLSWFPDGQRLLVAQGGSGSYALRTFDVAKQAFTVLCEETGSAFPDPSPDGRGALSTVKGRHGVVTEGCAVTDFSGEAPSPDGKHFLRHYSFGTSTVVELATGKDVLTVDGEGPFFWVGNDKLVYAKRSSTPETGSSQLLYWVDLEERQAPGALAAGRDALSPHGHQRHLERGARRAELSRESAGAGRPGGRDASRRALGLEPRAGDAAVAAGRLEAPRRARGASSHRRHPRRCVRGCWR